MNRRLRSSNIPWRWEGQREDDKFRDRKGVIRRQTFAAVAGSRRHKRA